MEDMNTIITDIVNRLKTVDGVTAIVLGGSRARGTHHKNSDIDIGIYYDSDDSLDIKGLQKVAEAIDDNPRDNILTNIGEWGVWINGGGWLTVNNRAVDLLYRDIKKVSDVINQCLQGDLTIDYYPGHPHGFINAIYLSEIALSKVLWDPHGVIAHLKGTTVPFPEKLKIALINKFLWEASFSIEAARKGIVKQDLSYVSGCLFRSISCVNQVLFALNECYWMNEKGALNIADSFPIGPKDFKNRVNQVFSLLSNESEKTLQGLSILQDIVTETDKLKLSI